MELAKRSASNLFAELKFSSNNVLHGRFRQKNHHHKNRAILNSSISLGSSKIDTCFQRSARYLQPPPKGNPKIDSISPQPSQLFQILDTYIPRNRNPKAPGNRIPLRPKESTQKSSTAPFRRPRRSKRRPSQSPPPETTQSPRRSRSPPRRQIQTLVRSRSDDRLLPHAHHRIDESFDYERRRK